MTDYEITKYDDLDDIQREQAVEIFLEGFGHLMTFTKDKEVLRKLIRGSMSPTLFKCYVENERVLGIIGLATNCERPLKFNRELCQELFGRFRGNILEKQMNAIFQKPVVKGEKELYIDVLATAGKARGRGVGTALLNYAFALDGYDTYFIEVFSKNPAANLYKKVGFSVYRKHKFSPLRLQGAGYPIMMKKPI